MILMLIDAIFSKLGLEGVDGIFITALCLLVEALIIMEIKTFKYLNVFGRMLGII